MNQEANQVTRQASAPQAGLETELRDAAPALAAALDPTAPVLDPREARRRAMDARCPLKRLVRSLAALLATAAVLVACGTPPAPQGDAELACVQEGYACRLADVDPAVLARSIALGDMAQQMFLDGDDAEQVAESLAAEDDVVYLAVGDGGLVFRVEGGTPVVVNPSVEQVPDDPTAGPLSVATPPGVDPERYAAYVSGWDSATPAGPGLVAGGDGPKSAIVMSMYQYEAGELDSSGYVAGILNAHHDYSGRVDYLYSNPLADEWVSVRDMLGLDEYELVYMVTHGGSLCVKEKVAPGARDGAGELAPAKAAGSGDCRTDILVHPYEGVEVGDDALEHVGVVLYFGYRTRSVAVTSDFFKHYYPDGMADTVFVLVACNTFRPDFSQTITGGGRGVFVSWDENVSFQAAWAAAGLVEVMLEMGIRTWDALDVLGDDAWDSWAGGRLRTTGQGPDGDLRIRNVLRVEEAHSGDDLRHAVETRVLGTPGDGQPDSLLLIGHLDGICPEETGRTQVSVLVGGQTRLSEPLEAIADPIDEFSWEFPMEVELGRDVLVGEVLDVEVQVKLPERGFATVRGSPRVVDQGPASGWFGTFTWRAERSDGISYEMAATALFALPDGTDPTADYLWFYLEDGSYTFSAEGTDAQSCLVQAQADGPLGPSFASYLKFDMTGPSPVVSAFGQSRTPDVLASVTCQDGSSYTMPMGTDKVFLYVPQSLGSTVTGDSFGGSYNEPGPWDNTWTWHFELRE